MKSVVGFGSQWNLPSSVLPFAGFCIDCTKQFEAAVTISTIGFRPFFHGGTSDTILHIPKNP